MLDEHEPDAVLVAAQPLHDPVDAVTGNPKTVSTPQSMSRSTSISDAIFFIATLFPRQAMPSNVVRAVSCLLRGNARRSKRP